MTPDLFTQLLKEWAVLPNRGQKGTYHPSGQP